MVKTVIIFLILRSLVLHQKTLCELNSCATTLNRRGQAEGYMKIWCWEFRKIIDEQEKNWHILRLMKGNLFKKNLKLCPVYFKLRDDKLLLSKMILNRNFEKL